MGHTERGRRRLERAGEDLGLVDDLRPARARRVRQGGDAAGAVALSPGDHRGSGDAQASRERRRSLSGGAGEHDAGSQRLTGGHLR